MDPDPLDVLAAHYPAWRLWRGCGNGLVYAWRLLTSPPVVVRDRTLKGLWARMDEYDRVYAELGSRDSGRGPALAAAERLDTSLMEDPE